MKVIIFLGPSLPLAEAKAILPDALYLPPAAQSDLLSAVTIYQPDVIGLIDGTFAQSLSVWHKEILFALEHGIYVYGSSSMGALRAAELMDFGMIGIGKVFELFADGTLNDDDEVAVLHSEQDDNYLNLSAPMVNVRATFEQAQTAGLIDAPTCESLITIAKARYFPDRTFPVIFEAAAQEGIAPEIIAAMREYVAVNYVDAKGQDAIALLQTIAALEEPLPPLENTVPLTHSHLFQTLYERDRKVLHEGVQVPLYSILYHAALHQPDFTMINYQALNRALVLTLAEMLKVTVEETEVDAEIERFCFQNRLRKDEAYQGWLSRNDITAEEFRSLMQDVATCRRMHRWLMVRDFLQRNTKLVLDEMRLQNRYEEAANETARKEGILQSHYSHFDKSVEEEQSVRKLVSEHLKAIDGIMEVPIPQWLAEVGFDGLEDLKVELQRNRLARRHQTRTLNNLASLLGNMGDEEA